MSRGALERLARSRRISGVGFRRRDHPQVCVVAILKDEARFVDEWLAYHRLLGAEHFVLYDHDPALGLRDFVAPHEEYVTVIDWPGRFEDLPGRDAQTKAYAHAVAGVASRYEWVAFIDVDEFIVLRKQPDLPSFLRRFGDCGAISLQWHSFGHNGFYRDPPGLVTASLTRRARTPGRMGKSITRTVAIADIPSAHYCELKRGYRRVDPSRQVMRGSRLANTEVAHINHYMTRSFERWMHRVERGNVAYDVSELPPHDLWQATEEGWLRQFVEVVAKDRNEYVDTFMLKYEPAILEHLHAVGARREWHVQAVSNEPAGASGPHRRLAISAVRRRWARLTGTEA